MNTLYTRVLRRAARLATLALLAAPLLAPTAPQAAIVDRGPGLAYDSSLNVTWVTDANLFDTLAASLGGARALAEAIYLNDPYVLTAPNRYSTRVTLPGMGPRFAYLLTRQTGGEISYFDFALGTPSRRTQFNWFAAQAFINYLNDTNYGGHDDWRLPRMLDGGCVIGVNTLDDDCAGGPWNEVQSLYRALGQQENLPLSLPSAHNDAYDLFSSHLGDHPFWLSDEIERVTREQDAAGNFLGFTFGTGDFSSALAVEESMFGADTFQTDKLVRYLGVMVLRDGDTLPPTDGLGASPVPLPGSLGLMAAALACGMASHRRRERRRRA